MSVTRRLAVLLCGLLLVGCGQANPTSLHAGDATAAASPSYSPIARQDACPAGQPEHLPDDLGLVEKAYVCSTELRPVAGQGEWSYEVVKGVVSGLDALLEAYQAADAPTGSGNCTADLPDPLVVYVHGRRAVAARAPWNVCAHPTPEARSAYEALGLKELSATKTRQVTTQESIDSKCSDAWKDMLAIEEESGPQRQPAGAPRPLTPPVRLCLYEVKADAQGERIGHLTTGRQLTPEQVEEVQAEVAKSVADASCGRHDHTRFALLAAGAGDFTLVALDGCALQQDAGFWRATDRLRSLLKS